MKNNLPKLIYYFGSDGTGKTKHAALTSSYLRKKGYLTWRASVKHHHTLSYLLLRLLRDSDFSSQQVNYVGFEGEMGRKIRTPWKILELASLFPPVFYRVLLPSQLGYIVICDRYVIDSIVTLSCFLKQPGLTAGTCAKILTALIPKHSMLIYLEADTNVILERKKDEPLTPQLIERYKEGYENVISRLQVGILRIDTTSATIQEVHQQAMQSMGLSG